MRHNQYVSKRMKEIQNLRESNNGSDKPIISHRKINNSSNLRGGIKTEVCNSRTTTEGSPKAKICENNNASV
jgi:hypothetical protein